MWIAKVATSAIVPAIRTTSSAVSCRRHSRRSDSAMPASAQPSAGTGIASMEYCNALRSPSAGIQSAMKATMK
jgi:hypothetical protein